MDIPPWVHFQCEIAKRFAAIRIRLWRLECVRKPQLPEGSAAGRLSGRAPECKRINPSPWSEVDGRRSFAR
jgi:hypothetical protein